jgi:hypothetical protein
MMKFLTTLAMLSAIATPSFAQSFCACDGTGNVLTFTHNPITLPQNAAIPAAQGGGHGSFAMVPASASAANSNSPATTGGGSAGYNEMLRNF